MAAEEKGIDVDVPIERMFEVVTDYESYPEFLPDVRKAVVASRKGNIVEVTFEIEVIKRIRYTLRMEETAPTELSWTLVKGDFMKVNAGGWRLESLGDEKTRATYAIELKLGAMVPSSITTKLAARNLPDTLERFKRRAEGA